MICKRPQTLALLRAYLQHCAERAAALGAELRDDAFVFSPEPDGSVWPKPDSATQRYTRMCSRLGWDMYLHQLRHYSATELIAAGVDIRTVAGRLGHGGGGATTLRVYSAWVAEADQRAANSLATRMPELPAQIIVDPNSPTPAPSCAHGSDHPYQRIAADLRAAIRCGALDEGDPLPTAKQLATRYSYSGACLLAECPHRARVLRDEESGHGQHVDRFLRASEMLEPDLSGNHPAVRIDADDFALGRG